MPSQSDGLTARKPEDTSSTATGDSALGKSSYTSTTAGVTELSEVSCTYCADRMAILMVSAVHQISLGYVGKRFLHGYRIL